MRRICPLNYSLHLIKNVHAEAGNNTRTVHIARDYALYVYTSLTIYHLGSAATTEYLKRGDDYILLEMPRI
jgi:hypothetical protein